MTKEPIPMPSHERPSERLAHSLEQLRRRSRVQASRVRELMKASRTHEGRQRYALSLIVVCGVAGGLLGFVLGWHSRRRV